MYFFGALSTSRRVPPGFIIFNSRPISPKIRNSHQNNLYLVYITTGKRKKKIFLILEVNCPLKDVPGKYEHLLGEK